MAAMRMGDLAATDEYGTVPFDQFYAGRMGGDRQFEGTHGILQSPVGLGARYTVPKGDPTVGGDLFKTNELKALDREMGRNAQGMAWAAGSPAEQSYSDRAQAEPSQEAIDALRWHGVSDAGIGLLAGSTAARMVPHPLARGAAMAPFVMGALLDTAEAGPRDPRLWSAISKTKLSKPLAEMEHRFTDIREPDVRYVDPASMVGGHLILTPWDLSRANRTLTHVDNIPLETPVRAHGGVGFPEANRGMAAASEHQFAKPLDNLASEYAEKGPVYIAPMTMSPQAIDASHHVADPLSQLVRKAPIKRDDVKAFNDLMREAVPDWVSIKSKNFSDYINNLQGGMTIKKLMADRMALAEWQAKGFPDVAAVRHAMTEPGLIDAPRNTWGMSISRYMPGQGLLETSHPSYSKGVAGEWMGQLARLSDYETGMPAAAKGIAEVNARNKAGGKKVAIQPAYHAGKPTEGVPRTQYLDAEWLDNLMKQQRGD